jgi:hypothetical protein
MTDWSFSPVRAWRRVMYDRAHNPPITSYELGAGMNVVV